MESTETKPIEYFKLGPRAGAFGKLAAARMLCVNSIELQIPNESE
jgi:hypothetical protein